MEFTEEELPYVKRLHLLTIKPVLYVANVGEEDIADPDANEYVRQVKEYARKDQAEVIVICAKIEEEIAELEGEEKALFFRNWVSRNRVSTN